MIDKARNPFQTARASKHMKNRSLLFLVGSVLGVSCGGGSASITNPDGSNVGGNMNILEASNGFGKLLPHEIAVADPNGLPTGTTIEITSVDDLLLNLTPTNPILPVTQWPVAGILPNHTPGNHFVYVRFSQRLDVDSVLNPSVGAAVDNNLTGAISVLMVDPVLGSTVPVRGKGFVGGRTYGPTVDSDNPTSLVLEEWVRGTGDPSVLTPILAIDTDNNPDTLPVFPGLGFPGTEDGFSGASSLVGDNVFCFVVDSDDDLTTHEVFPVGVQIQVRISEAVRSVENEALARPGLASSTVGADMVPPEVAVAGAAQIPLIIPGNGEIDVDPETNIEVTFTEPIQLTTLGSLDDGTPPLLSAAILLQFGPSISTVSVPFSVMPFSVFDLSRYQLRPQYNFPGAAPALAGIDCGSFSDVRVIVNPAQFTDLIGNTNTLSPSTGFVTRSGAGLVNAPVTPDTIYVGRGGSQQAISVIDLNGFGQGTGNPTYDDNNPVIEGNSNWPNNPNVALQGALMCPPLGRGFCTFDGGSSGVFTLVRDSALNDTVTGFPVLETVGDMLLGHALDSVFNNAQPFGCQAGGGNICAATGLKQIVLIQGGPNTLISVNENPIVAPVKTEIGSENLVSWAPHPNPPPIDFPPLCTAPLILGQEPSAVDNILPPPPLGNGKGLQNLLTPGSFPLGIPEIGLPPSGLLALEQNTFFEGPSLQLTLAACNTYMMRQQIGQFLYVVDRVVDQQNRGIFS